jgi:threonine/homoserine/homoserine lactone efflux protein
MHDRRRKSDIGQIGHSWKGIQGGVCVFTTEFILTSLIVVLVPGTGVIYTLSNGLFRGWRASIAAALGCTAGILPHLTASVLGLSAILHTSALIFQIVKYAGTAYLLYLAWSMWRQADPLKIDSPSDSKGWLQIVVRGFLINILNPKLSIFFLAFLPLFISAETPSPTFQLVVLSIAFMLMTLVIFILYGLGANGVRRYVMHSTNRVVWLQRTFAAAFALFGVKLLMTDP